MADPKDPRPPSMSMPDAVGPSQLGEYRLLEELGEGGMGLVYRALHTQLNRVVALKVLPTERTEDEEAIQRFQREMKAVGCLDHPNIVRAHDARQIEGQRVLVMEYVDGLDLGDLVQRLGPLPVPDACELVRQAAVGLQHAHEHGLVHRDVKPSNLMLSRDGKVKILDLGLALVQVHWTDGEEMTVPGQVMGTPDYMAPEQASDSHAVDARADLYSLGCTFYKLLVGQPPFTGPAYQSVFNKMSAHVKVPVPPVQHFRADVPDELVPVLGRMLAKVPRERFSTAAEVADALSPFAAGCDLSRLLTEAERRPKPPRQKAGRAVAADRLPLPGATSRPRGGVTEPKRPVPPPAPWWRRPETLVAALALLVASIGLTWAIIHRRETGDVGLSGREEVERDKREDVLPPLPPERPWFLFSWKPPDLSGKPDLWLFDPRGESRLRVTRDEDSFAFHAQVSPDGRRIVFVRGAVPTGPTAIWICDTDGGNLRVLAAADDAAQRLLSPVWRSNSRICYTKARQSDGSLGTEVCEIDPDGEAPRLLFRFSEALDKNAGLVTDVSPDGLQLAVIAQNGNSAAATDVYVADSQGKLVQTVWEDGPDGGMDLGAVWSPDGKRMAWRHYPPPGAANKTVGGDVGYARLGPDGQWSADVQREVDAVIFPLAWAPDSRVLLCARFDDNRRRHPRVTLFLMDAEFQPVRKLFDLDQWWRLPPAWDGGRPADWTVLPADAPLPIRGKSRPPDRKR